MKRPLSICVVSGGRADYGLLVCPLRAIRADPAFKLDLVLTGQHLERGAGNTAERVRVDGFDVAAEVDIGLSNADDAAAVTRAAGRALIGMADVLARLAPDIMLVLGDRYEILCCAIGATIAKVPIAHIAGGDITEGAFDDSFRHAITKMAHLHLVTTTDAARRVRQLGEPADRIHLVGSPGIDLLRTAKVPARDGFFASVGLAPRKMNVIVTFHPVTRHDDSLPQLDELLGALAAIDDATILFTGSNADPEGRQIEDRIRAFVGDCPDRCLVSSLGAELYFGALAHMDAVVGNSSSGLYEAPSFGIPTVNVGDRQRGRLRAASVFDCPAERGAISAAIAAALARGRQATPNPYGDGHASERIVTALKSINDPRDLLVKTFADLAVP
jgi:UDP-hydrolysing UDP-N-acetyl-D-glucosamine 2-epimerase